jgi:5-methyltetrahydrofolate--homocysteine methyltransferase
LDFAEKKRRCKSNEKAIQEWRSGTIQERLTHSLVKELMNFSLFEEARLAATKYRSYRN